MVLTSREHCHQEPSMQIREMLALEVFERISQLHQEQLIPNTR